MSFQRDDITIEERMRIVTTILSQPHQYGLVTQLAREHDLSRESVYTLLQRGRAGLADGLRARPPGHPPLSVPLVVDQNRLDRAIVTFTLAGHASLEGVQGCLAEVFDLHRSIGYISGVLDRAGAAAHTGLAQLCPPRPVRADLDEIFSGATPHLALIDHDSTLILALEQAERRDATTWGVLLLDEAAKGVVIAEAASDGARGIRGGIAESNVVAVRLGDLFHVVRDLMVVAGQLEKRAYGAIEGEERARLADAEAHAAHPRRGPKRRSALAVADAVAASAVAIQRSDDYAWLVGQVRETLEPVDARTGRLHAADGSRQELLAVASLLREWGDEPVTKIAGRLERAVPDLVAYQEVLAQHCAPWVAQVGEATVALIAWAWRHRQGLGLTTPAAVAAAFPGDQQPAVDALWAILDGVHRGSSLVECVNSLLRPHLLVHRGADQGLLDLLTCYFNHRVFSRGKRRGKSPLQLAGLTDTGDWLISVGFAPKRPGLRPQASHEPAARQPAQSVNRLAA